MRASSGRQSWLASRQALTRLKQHPGKQSIALKRRQAGWIVDFLVSVRMTQATLCALAVTFSAHPGWGDGRGWILTTTHGIGAEFRLLAD